MPESRKTISDNIAFHEIRHQKWFNKQFLAWISVPLIGSVLLGFYCCELNQQLYQHQNPFFDSLSYYESLFRVMTVSDTEGLSSGLEEGCFHYTTVCLPFIFAAAIGDWVEPTRLVGVWIQVIYLALFQISLFYYLTRIKRLQHPTATLGCLTFLATACLFFFQRWNLRFPHGSWALPYLWNHYLLVFSCDGKTKSVALWLVGNRSSTLLPIACNCADISPREPRTVGFH